MLFVTHIALALHIGAWTSHPVAALIGSLFSDIDHFVPLKKHGRFSWRKLLHHSLQPTLDYPPRSFLHNILSLAVLGALTRLLFPAAALAFSLGFAGHLLLDTLDHTDIHLFYPWKKNIKGPVTYNSFTEHVIAVVLLVLYIVLYA